MENYQLEDFDDFVEMATGTTIFYQIVEVGDKVGLIAQSNKIFWKQKFDNSITMNEYLQVLRSMKAKQILGTSEQVFL